MKQGEWGDPSSEHEVVYHAASQWQAASLSLPLRCLHGLKRACSVDFSDGFAWEIGAHLSRFACVKLPGSLKSRRNRGLMRLEQGAKDPCPDSRESTNGHRMPFAFCPFAL